MLKSNGEALCLPILRRVTGTIDESQIVDRERHPTSRRARLDVTIKKAVDLDNTPML
jgi:hypothetical protein